MKPTTHIMLDLETLGVGPSPAIVQVGLVIFTATEIIDARRWDVCYDLDIRRGGQVDGSTLRWWLAQSPQALRALDAALPQLPSEVLHEIETFLPLSCAGYWANGVDWAWLEALRQRWTPSIRNLVEYSFLRDMRTLRKTVGRGIKVERDVETMHDARADALWGARWLQEAHRKLGGVL